MLSKVERGKLFPTLPTLLRIALVFSVELEYFFAEDRKRHVVGIARRSERKRFPERPDGRDISFYFESLDFAAVERKLNAYHAEFQPLQSGKAAPTIMGEWSSFRCCVESWKSTSGRLRTFWIPEMRFISTLPCRTPTGESAANRVRRSWLPCREDRGSEIFLVKRLAGCFTLAEK
jgi:transcriptional regulator with XRE-family HTH domain